MYYSIPIFEDFRVQRPAVYNFFKNLSLKVYNNNSNNTSHTRVLDQQHHQIEQSSIFAEFYPEKKSVSNCATKRSDLINKKTSGPAFI